jgi:beta-lactamase regulating signal transducer with metallopeptidase domain
MGKKTSEDNRMNMINTIFSERLIESFGWTLVHSLWQGAVVALVLMAVLLFMHKNSARTRYLAGVLALGVMLVLSFVTFIDYYGAPSGTYLHAIQPDSGSLPVNGALSLNTGATENGSWWAVFFKDYFQKHLPLMVTIWLMGILFLTLRFAGGYIYNWRIKTRHSRRLKGTWPQTLKRLQQKIGVSKPVTLMESALIKVPMAMGHLKPVILLPVGMVTGLPREQVEALLAHELAHILRRDYLVNMFQHFMDILYFYHPGIRWISAQVRMERENCCDDMAVTCTDDSITYARALTNIQANDAFTGNLEPAVAATGKVPRLLNRVKRLVHRDRAYSNVRGGISGALIMIICMFSLVIVNPAATILENRLPQMSAEKSQEVPDVPEPPEKPEVKEPAEPESAPEPESPPEKEVAEKEKELKKEKEKREKKELKIEKKRKIKLQKKEIKKQKEAEKEAKKERKKQEKMKAAAVAMEELERRHMEKLKRQELGLVKLKKKHNETLVSSKEELKRIKREMARQERELSKESGHRKAELEKMKMEMDQRLEELKRIKAKEMAAMKKELTARKQELAKSKRELELEKAFYKTLTRQLVEDKLIDDPGHYNFRITTDKLIIDGQTQPVGIFKKYKSFIESHRGPLEKDKNFHVIIGGSV